jgi:hypothetical protein
VSVEASGEEGRRAGEALLRCGMLWEWRCPFTGVGRGALRWWWSEYWADINGLSFGWFKMVVKEGINEAIRQKMKVVS